MKLQLKLLGRRGEAGLLNAIAAIRGLRDEVVIGGTGNEVAGVQQKEMLHFVESDLSPERRSSSISNSFSAFSWTSLPASVSLKDCPARSIRRKPYCSSINRMRRETAGWVTQRVCAARERCRS